MNKLLEQDYFLRDDVVQIARDLIGKKLVTEFSGQITGGYITETEAYAGKGDQACHAHLGKFTKRTKVMYEAGGIAYVYLCYGIHHLFNIITNQKDHADAVLIRAIEPTDGVDLMLERRHMEKIKKNISAGPGNVSKALGITKTQNAQSVTADELKIVDTGKTAHIITSTRIGIGYAGEDVNLPWRFYDKDSKFVSKR
jgi:DNA-3-methyladenine glycosylase